MIEFCTVQPLVYADLLFRYNRLADQGFEGLVAELEHFDELAKKLKETDVFELSTLKLRETNSS